MKEKNLNILIAGLGVEIHVELKGNLTDSTVWNTGETGVIVCMKNGGKNCQFCPTFITWTIWFFQD